MAWTSFLPGRAAEATALYREAALPLYRADDYLLGFRAFREVESPIPVDLVIVRGFDGLAGMERSGARLREVATAQGTSVGALYGRIGALSQGHTDEFVEMLPRLGSGDPAATRWTVFIRLRLVPGVSADAEAALETVARWERQRGLATSTARFLIGDG